MMCAISRQSHWTSSHEGARMKVRTRRPRKLLSASLGVAAVSYVACGGSTTSAPGAGGFVGNLVGPPHDAAAGAGGTGNPRDGASGAGGGGNPFDVVANLVVAPIDAAPDHSDASSDATDATRDARDSASDAPAEGGSPFDVVANLVVAPQDSGR